MSRVRIHNMFVSLDGFAAGTHVTAEKPIGDASALFAGFDGRLIHGLHHVDAPITIDRALTTLWGQGIGVEIMGRRKFGPQSGPWTDADWRGWWGEEPPFRTPVIVLTHYPREPMEFADGTVFHFLAATPAKALARARELAPGTDVRIGGGPSVVRQFLEADLVDFMHAIVVPVVLGEGQRAYPGGLDLAARFDREIVSTPTGYTHQLWNRRPQS